MKRLLLFCLFLAAFCWMPASAFAENCTGLPTSFGGGNEFPKGNFFSNFDNNCYLIPFSTGNGAGGEQGDLNSVYNKLYFNACPAGATICVNPALPPYELIILGQFPNSRYFSVGLYDNHSAITKNITDQNLVPLTATDINPYEPGLAFVSGQRYGAAIHLGGTPGNVQTGCMMNGYNVESNAIDGTQRHAYMNWNLDPGFFGPPPHYLYPDHDTDTPEHTNPNTAGVIIIRSYLDLTVATAATQPHVIVRDVASGCAYPAAYVTGTMNVVTTNSTTGNAWQDQDQVQIHDAYANYQPTDCWGTMPYSKIQWLRQDEYVAGANPDAGYLIANVPSGLPQTLAAANEVMRLRFRVPATPPTPCVNGCSRSGNEQMRYLSISFQIPGGGTLASLADSCPANPITPCAPLVQDANGNVTLVVGTGTVQPAWVTAANGYTWLDLTKTGSTYTTLNEIAIRHILASSWFNCGAEVVPYKVGDSTANTLTGPTGLMSTYAPLIDYPVATSLPTAAAPPTCGGNTPCPSGCAVFPAGPPAVANSNGSGCSILPPNPMAITQVSTQCDAPLCNQVVVQSTPPIEIVGQGFGSFPLGLPYTGNSTFLQITDTTQKWSAGYNSNPCTLTVGEWSDGLISLIANVNQNGVCPMAASDNLKVTVWNPQNVSSNVSFTTTVAAQTSSVRQH